MQTASSGSLGLSNDLDVVVLYDPSAGIDVAFLPYGYVDGGEPSVGANVSLSRYPDGGEVWVTHPVRVYSIGGQLTPLQASPGTAPDNARP